MKTFLKTWIPLGISGVLVFALILIASQSSIAAGPWYVAPGGDDGNTCTSPAAPCATINGALGKATSGDTTYVAIGTYTGNADEVLLIDKDINLSGGWDDAFSSRSGTSTINGEDIRRGIVVNEGVSANVDHFTIQHGYTGDGNGGGVYNSGTLTLTHSTISDSYAYYSGYGGHGGGGIHNIGTLTLTNSTVSNNTATDGGGGIYGTSGSSTVIIGTQIYANTAINVQGGGIEFDYGSDLTMSSSWVVGNAAIGNDGGGVGFDHGGTAYIENSIIAGNFTDGTGGGLFLVEGGPYHVVNSHIIGNQANSDGAAIVGMAVHVEITNTLIISNIGVTGIDTQWDSGAAFLLSYCDTYGNSPDGTVNVTITRIECLGTPPVEGLDPMMVGGTLPSGVGPDYADQWLGYDYRLQPGSPAINAGTSIGAPTTDIDGMPRDAIPDIGAYEYLLYKYLYIPLVVR